MITPTIETRHRSDNGGAARPRDSWKRRAKIKGRVLVVEDEKNLRDSLGNLLNESGYEVSVADHGHDALSLLRSEPLPDLIILDLKMPVMDGWEFRTIQKDDPKLGLIPVLAVSADASPKAAAISAQGYLRKPFDSGEVMAAVERLLAEREETTTARLDETERTASLGRLAANVGHEINNPLTFVMLNLSQSLEELRAALGPADAMKTQPLLSDEIAQIEGHIRRTVEMLQDCELGADRIRGTVTDLQQLSPKTIAYRSRLDVQKILEESTASTWNQIRHPARLTTCFNEMAHVRGNRAAIGQAFLNLLVYAADSIPDGDAERHEIRIETTIDRSRPGAELVVEIRDSGRGIAPELVSRVFEPYFTANDAAGSVGLGLSISRQIIHDHGGRLTVESTLGQGTTFRVALPVDLAVEPPASGPQTGQPCATAPVRLAPRRGSVLVIDDEPLIGRVIRGILKGEHDVVVFQGAAEALAQLEQGAAFDMILCDLVMPDVNGAEFHARLVDRWPELLDRLVFMTGGACTPETVEFLKRVTTKVIAKPIARDELRELVRAHVVQATQP